MVRSGEQHSSLPLRTCFWPRGVHANSRGKTVTDFQDCSRSKSRPQVEMELAQRYDLTLNLSRIHTHTHLRVFGGHIRASSITCGWPRTHIKTDFKFTQPLWDCALLILAITISAYKPESFEPRERKREVGI